MISRLYVRFPGIVVSIEIPGIVVSLEILSVGSLRIPGIRRLTRDSRNRRLTRDSNHDDGVAINYVYTSAQPLTYRQILDVKEVQDVMSCTLVRRHGPIGIVVTKQKRYTYGVPRFE